MILRRIHPSRDEAIDLDAPDASERLTNLYRPPREPWLRLNLVASASGSAAGTDGTSESLTNRADRAVLRAIRALADVVLVGAASVRAEGYFVPKQAALAIVTNSGDLGTHRIIASGERGPVLILCPPAAAAAVAQSLGAVVARIIPIEPVGDRLAAADIVSALRGEGLLSIVCEGGPSLAAQLLEEGMVDELCLTTSPVLNGTELPLFGERRLSERPLELEQLAIDDAGALYARWLIRADRATQ